MHILAGESALRALRAVRSRGIPVWLPYPDCEQRCVLLPGQSPEGADGTQPDSACPAEQDEASRAEEPTLAKDGFAFDKAETHARVELFRLGDVGRFTKERPLELAVFDYGHRTTRKKSRTRVLPRNLPASALIKVDPGLYFVCPELIVLELAPRMTPTGLSQVIMELCGTYSLHPNPDAAEGASYNLDPVTTLWRIGQYGKRVRSRGGTDVLRRALAMAMEGSASPSETKLAIMMSLPREQGGYELGRPVLNGRITVPDEFHDFVDGRVYYPDAFWQEAYVDMEYQSTEFHLDPLAAMALVPAPRPHADTVPEANAARAQRQEFITKQDADLCRMRELGLLGVNVVPVTSFDLKTVHRMDQIACILAREHARAGGLDWETWQSDLAEQEYREARESLLRELNGTGDLA